MELVVLVDGYERKISGAVENSTVADVITALADANNKNGKFMMALRNKTNNIDYYLRSTDIPFKVLKSLQERGIDACLEVFDANQLSNMFPAQEWSEQTEFENMLAGMTREELEEFIQNQEKILWNHQIKILGIEGALTDETDREHFQLLRQKHNLRRILDELESVDWQRHLLSELNELNRLKSAIEIIRVEIEKKNRKLEEIYRVLYIN